MYGDVVACSQAAVLVCYDAGAFDIDVFVGGRVSPLNYPETPDSYLLLNDGKGNFTDKTKDLAPGLQK